MSRPESAGSLLNRFRHPLVAVAAALLLTVPFVVLFTTHDWHLDPASTPEDPGMNIAPSAAVLVGGLAILGAAFLLAWGTETAEKDVPTAFAIAVLAVLAVAPEYAVDALYAWQAGADPGPSEAANLAIANMTGANRILIGLGGPVSRCSRSTGRTAPTIRRWTSALDI